MSEGDLSVGELADRAGLSRRAVRFYVQQQLLPAPNGLGRGKHYDQSHLDRLTRIIELQQAGHSLDAIRKILDGKAVPAPVKPTRRLPRPTLSAELWTRLKLIEGVELHFDASRHNPEAEKLLALRDAVRDVFAAQPDDSQEDD